MRQDALEGVRGAGLEKEEVAKTERAREESLLRGCSQGGDVQMSVIVLWIKYTDKQLSGVLALFRNAAVKIAQRQNMEFI